MPCCALKFGSLRPDPRRHAPRLSARYEAPSVFLKGVFATSASPHRGIHQRPDPVEPFPRPVHVVPVEIVADDDGFREQVHRCGDVPHDALISMIAVNEHQIGLKAGFGDLLEPLSRIGFHRDDLLAVAPALGKESLVKAWQERASSGSLSCSGLPFQVVDRNDCGLRRESGQEPVDRPVHEPTSTISLVTSETEPVSNSDVPSWSQSRRGKGGTSGFCGGQGCCAAKFSRTGGLSVVASRGPARAEV